MGLGVQARYRSNRSGEPPWVVDLKVGDEDVYFWTDKLTGETYVQLSLKALKAVEDLAYRLKAVKNGGLSSRSNRRAKKGGK